VNISELRRHYHAQICAQIIRVSRKKGKEDYPNFADGDSAISRQLAWGIVDRIGGDKNFNTIKGQTAGKRFEVITKEFLEESFALLTHMRPGDWHYSCEQTAISQFEQYAHLAYIESVFKNDLTLGSAFGGNYIVRPDIVISRQPVSDQTLDETGILADKAEAHAQFTPLRQRNQTAPILHAVISCKWTTRNDRAQNTRTEVLNLIRNRKGKLPHVVAITAEPFPSRIAALALGTGDLDCVYHFALHELLEAAQELNNEESLEVLNMMVQGRRLRDVSDLPFDLAI
jgi:hypothetical protein